MDNTLNQLIHETCNHYVKQLIAEAMSIGKLENIITKNYSDKFNQSQIKNIVLPLLIDCDPTSVSNDRGRFVGRYWKWILALLAKGTVHQGDSPELKAALNTYNINKSRINKPIDAFNNLDELVQEIAQYNDSFKAGRTLSKGEQELEKVYEDEYVTVYVPHTWEAARKIGGDTRWCTASSNNKYFNYYLNRYGGEYYDIIRKRDGAKFQIHPESLQFMDSDDEETNFFNVFGMKSEAEGVIGFLESEGKEIDKWLPRTWPEEVQDKLNSRVPPEDVFDYVGIFKEGMALVELNNVMNYIKKVNGRYELLSLDMWFDKCWGFYNGYGIVKKDEKFNYINTNGSLLSSEWYDDCYNFSEGYGRVKKGGKWNYINKKCELLSSEWYDMCWPFSGGYGIVIKGDKYNYITTDGSLLSGEWFDRCWDFIGGYGKVKKGEKYNYITTDGRLLSSEWFDTCLDFSNGHGVVEKDGKYNYINKDGELLDIDTLQPVKRLNENTCQNPGIYEISPSEIDVKQFQKKTALNGSFWHNGKLDSRIRLRLLDLADDFIEGLNIKWVKPEDIVFTGSLANYNWHEQSDIDVHIIMDYDKIHKNHDFVKSYIDSKKEMWCDEHDTLKIKGYPVEMYVEDANSETDPSGAYSLTKGEWLRKPVDSDDIRFNENLVRRKAAKYITKIDDLCDEIDSETDRHKSEIISKKLKVIFDKLKNFRKNGLQCDKKEMSVGNILWKVVKHNGSIKKLWDRINKSYDFVNSIDECKII